MQLSTTIQNMTLQEVVLAVLLQKTGTAYFNKDALARGFKHVSSNHRPLQGLFATQPDPVSRKPSIALNRILQFLDRCQVLKDAGDNEHMFMTKHGRAYAESELKENHGADVLNQVKPLSDQVWAFVDSYTRMMN
ncbi:hypothetical protein HZB03_03665 [Candidatus Woesearchaeota archaeon]|nr:hypothetical protein [Candidatus Woesearchaeota archaeon]